MKHIIIGTAGHVDHGKTCLTKALTGVDTDRLLEEQRRGITIDIGFAQLTLPGGQTASIIDVPGHEKFIRNMLVGASGMDVVLLVVAADEGFMPQTREHLGILSLLGVKRGILVLTKSDLVDGEWLEAITEECRQEVAGTFLEHAPILPVSSFTKAGLSELTAEIAALVSGAEERSTQKPFRLPVDRVFSAAGFGTVVTGTLKEGTLRVGDEVTIYPRGKKARVRGLQNHSAPLQFALAGQRVAVNLAGTDKADLHRGDTLAHSGSLALATCVDAALTLLPTAPFSVKNGSRLHLHHDTGETLCQCILLGQDVLAPGETAFAQLRLTDPIAGRTGDAFVLRFFSPLVTVGGGVLLNLSAQKHRRNDPDVLAGLTARASGSQETKVLQALDEAGESLPLLRDLAASLSLSLPELDEILAPMVANGSAVLVGERVASAAVIAALWQRTEALLSAYHQAQPLQNGMNRSELRGKLLPKLPLAADPLLDLFSAVHGLKREGPTVALADFSVVWTPSFSALRQKLEAIYQTAGLAPENSEVVDASFGNQTPACRKVVARLQSDGVLVALSPQLRLHRDHYLAACRQLSTLFDAAPALTLGELRDGLGVSRKYALALLEYWDGTGITKKAGDVRVLLKKPC